LEFYLDSAPYSRGFSESRPRIDISPGTGVVLGPVFAPGETGGKRGETGSPRQETGFPRETVTLASQAPDFPFLASPRGLPGTPHGTPSRPLPEAVSARIGGSARPRPGFSRILGQAPDFPFLASRTPPQRRFPDSWVSTLDRQDLPGSARICQDLPGSASDRQNRAQKCPSELLST
jgi:hypothetical protein